MSWSGEIGKIYCAPKTIRFMKKGIWNEIVCRLADKGITEDHAALYIPHFQTGEDHVKWTPLCRQKVAEFKLVT